MWKNTRKGLLISCGLILSLIVATSLHRRNQERAEDASYPEEATKQPDPTWIDSFTSTENSPFLMDGLLDTEDKVSYNKVVDLALNPNRLTAESSSRRNDLTAFYNYPLLTICDLISKFNSLKSPARANKTLTPQDCRNKCVLKDKLFATLFRGKCLCENSYQPGRLHNLETCDALCALTEPDCDVAKRKHAIVMRAVFRDGDKHWTEWMAFGELNVKTRYRACTRYQKKDTECSPEYQRTVISAKKPAHPAAASLIGCFTGFSLMTDSLHIQQKKIMDNRGAQVHELCQKLCALDNSSYALTSTSSPAKFKTRTCYCTNTLAKSQPTNSCTGLGYAAHWTKIDQSEPVLKFQGETKKEGKVLILARFRSGSSMTQSLFMRYPDPFILFEPASMEDSPGHNDRAFLSALGAFFSCSAEKIPPFFLEKSYLNWSNEYLSMRGQTKNFMKKVQACVNARLPVDCTPYWLEACQHSKFLNVKVIRVFDVEAVRDFVERNQDVNMIHLVRDPRGLLSAQKVHRKQPPAAPLCKQMVEVGEMVQEMRDKGAKNVHEVHYKDIAVNTSYYAEKLYREMGIEMPKEVIKFVAREEYDNHIPEKVSRVVRSNPEAHIYGFINRYSLQRILEIDTHCSNVYKFWSDHYSDFWTLYKEHADKVNRYARNAKRKIILSYLRKHKGISIQ